MRYPYRDRRLVEFMLAVPGHQLYNRGRYKHVLRQAMAGVLPEEIRLRVHPTSLLPLCVRGLLEREGSTVRGLVEAPDVIWPHYVRRDWLEQVFPARLGAGIDGVETVVPWLCLSVELWRQGFDQHDRVRYTIEDLHV
jgi:asparagine synthase (glutamine-hydrolysing)